MKIEGFPPEHVSDLQRGRERSVGPGVSRESSTHLRIWKKQWPGVPWVER